MMFKWFTDWSKPESGEYTSEGEWVVSETLKCGYGPMMVRRRKRFAVLSSVLLVLAMTFAMFVLLNLMGVLP
jgi:hypothetical protein